MYRLEVSPVRASTLSRLGWTKQSEVSQDTPGPLILSLWIHFGG